LLKEDVKAYGNNKLVIPVPDTVPDAVKVVHVMSCVMVDPVDTVKFPLGNTILLAHTKPPVILHPPLVMVKPLPTLAALFIIIADAVICPSHCKSFKKCEYPEQ